MYLKICGFSDDYVYATQTLHLKRYEFTYLIRNIISLNCFLMNFFMIYMYTCMLMRWYTHMRVRAHTHIYI